MALISSSQCSSSNLFLATGCRSIRVHARSGLLLLIFGQCHILAVSSLSVRVVERVSYLHDTTVQCDISDTVFCLFPI